MLNFSLFAKQISLCTNKTNVKSRLRLKMYNIGLTIKTVKIKTLKYR